MKAVGIASLAAIAAIAAIAATKGLHVRRGRATEQQGGGQCHPLHCQCLLIKVFRYVLD